MYRNEWLKDEKKYLRKNAKKGWEWMLKNWPFPTQRSACSIKKMACQLQVSLWAKRKNKDPGHRPGGESRIKVFPEKRASDKKKYASKNYGDESIKRENRIQANVKFAQDNLWPARI